MEERVCACCTQAAGEPVPGSGRSEIPFRMKWINRGVRELPLDPEEQNYVRRSVPGACFSRVQPTPLQGPRLLAVSEPAVRLMGISPDEIKEHESVFVDLMSGCLVAPGSEPAAHTYCGHQFGHFAGQLGDGRAILLGEVALEDGTTWEIQLKGAGKTPYSRTADGRAVLRSSVREFLCSEAMHALGIATTRAATLISSDTTVMRDPLYDGHPVAEPATVVSRLAPCFIRFGSFELCLEDGPSPGMDNVLLPQLLRFVIRHHYPSLWHKYAPAGAEDPADADTAAAEGDDTDGGDASVASAWHPLYEAFFAEVVRRTAVMVAEWQCVGFCHGVLNTDNMSILGLTIDYGPFGWMDAFDPNFVCNGSDHGARYSYANQPDVCRWNLKRLAKALSLSIPPEVTKPLWESLYGEVFEAHRLQKMRRKLGLLQAQDTDTDLVRDLFDVMASTRADMTNTLRSLARLAGGEASQAQLVDHVVSQCAPLAMLKAATKPSMPRQQVAQLIQLARANPMILYQHGIRPEMVAGEWKKYQVLDELEAQDEDERKQAHRQAWTTWIASYAQRLLADGEQDVATCQQRATLMNENNPKYVLRNWIAQEAIEAAEGGDTSLIDLLQRVLAKPFEDHPEANKRGYGGMPPLCSAEICVTCSS